MSIFPTFYSQSPFLTVSTRWLSEHRVLSRVEIELANHGGNDNGHLPVTKQDFIDYGVSGRLVASSVRANVALGFLRVTMRGRGGNAEHRQPNHFLLTFAYGRDSRAQPTVVAPKNS
jgi:hypothetical protein